MPSNIRVLGLSLLAATLWWSPASRSPAAQLEKDPPALTAGQRNAPMVVKVVRDGRPGCGNDCGEWIAMEGRLVAGVTADFERALRKLHGRKVPVFIDSGGGAVRDAMAIGRLIRSHHLDVAVIETIDCPSCGHGAALTQERGAVCASACVLVLAAGENRIVSPTSAVGVHQMTVRQTQILVRRNFRIFYGGDLWGRRREIARVLLSTRPIAVRTTKGPASASTNREVAHYLETMGIGRQLMPLMLATPSDSIRWLNAGEMKTSALMTAQSAGATLLAKADPSGRTPEPAAPLSDDARLDVVVGTRIKVEKGTVAWRLDRGEGRHVALAADIVIPARRLRISLRIVPATTAAAAPLLVEVAVKATGGSPSGDRVQKVFPLEARSATRAEAVLTADARSTGDMTWQLDPHSDATFVGPGAPARLGLGLILDWSHADLSFAAGTVTMPLYRDAARDWALEVARKPPPRAPVPQPMIKVSAPSRSPA